MHTAVNKAIRVGKATMLAIGVGVVLALVLGLATVALAAVPGDPFKLGKINTINKLTTLVGSVDGAMLKVDNNSTGTFATALDLQVESGKPPMKVNSSSRVANLNSDRLDGKDSTEFLGKGDKAFNSDKLDGLDFPDFIIEDERDELLPSDTYVVTRTVPGPGGGTNRVASADCDPGDKLLSGGGTGNTDQDDQLLSSVPFGQGWDVVVSDNGFASDLTVHVVCADFPPLR